MTQYNFQYFLNDFNHFRRFHSTNVFYTVVEYTKYGPALRRTTKVYVVYGIHIFMMKAIKY